jgi:hypothetical protein
MPLLDLDVYRVTFGPLDALLDPARRLFGAERAVVVATHALNSRTLTCVRNVNEFSVIGSRSA